MSQNATNSVVYFDNNATTKVAPEVFEAMLPFLQEEYGNPSSMYGFAAKSQEAVATARAQVADLIGAAPEEIIFTSCGTESDSTAIYAALRARPGKRHFITTRVEHPAVLAVANFVASQGYAVDYLDVDSKGNIDLEQLKKLISGDTALVSMMMANNETGVIFPVAEAAAICQSYGVPMHTDAVQAVGKLDIDMKTLPPSRRSSGTRTPSRNRSSSFSGGSW